MEWLAVAYGDAPSLMPPKSWFILLSTLSRLDMDSRSPFRVAL